MSISGMKMSRIRNLYGTFHKPQNSEIWSVSWRAFMTQIELKTKIRRFWKLNIIFSILSFTIQKPEACRNFYIFKGRTQPKPRRTEMYKITARRWLTIVSWTYISVSVESGPKSPELCMCRYIKQILQSGTSKKRATTGVTNATNRNRIISANRFQPVPVVKRLWLMRSRPDIFR